MKTEMTKRETTEFQARLADDSGIIWGKIPSPLLRVMGARPGYYAHFSWDGEKATMRVVRSKGAARAGKGAKRSVGRKER
jgi:hypothetical protein